MAGRRSQARRYALLGLYQWQMTGQSPAVILRHFFDDPAWMQVIAEGLGLTKGERQSVEEAVYDLALFQELMRGVPEQVEDLDRRLQQVLDRPLRQVTPVDQGRWVKPAIASRRKTSGSCSFSAASVSCFSHSSRGSPNDST